MAADAVADETGLAEFRILGPLEVRRSGRAVPLGGPRQRAVLAVLLLQANRVVSADRLGWASHPETGTACQAGEPCRRLSGAVRAQCREPRWGDAKDSGQPLNLVSGE